jgi:hypothetical protein
MGSNAHKPHTPKADWHGSHDDKMHATGPGERPGVPSRIEAARERAKRRGDL